jgi:hypothetical protein
VKMKIYHLLQCKVIQTHMASLLSISHPEMFNICMRRSGTVKHNEFLFF